ncbi:hypothetical protein SH668x_000144 [Planctomicrobium sp. SH668]|uniref:hypothetical protein n=1 Tax=Planctomicrobium sp. SH668 TaxID=3448126 RepID=UPI003F5C0622
MSFVPAELLSLFPPARQELFNYVRCHVDSIQLREIAMADYGWGAEEVLPLLQTIAGRGIFPADMPFPLREVLQLTMYSNPENPNPPPHRPGPSGRTGHQTRLFACTVKMLADTDPAISFEDDSTDSTLASALTSAEAMGAEAMLALGRLLSWRVSTVGSDEPVLMALGILVLALSQPPKGAGPFLEPLADWVLSTDAEFQEQLREDGWKEPRPLPFSVQRGAWQPMRDKLQAASQCDYPATLREKLQLCALLLDPF